LDHALVVSFESLFVHSSFAEFLENPHLSLNFTICPGKALKQLVLGCLDCMSSITLESKAPDELHVRYAVLEWPHLWREWRSQLMPAISDSHQPWAIPPEWLEMCQRLLSVDLVACFVLAFTQNSWPIERFPHGMVNNGPEHLLIGGLSDDTYHSETLAQQAVLHVTTSLTTAILRCLKSAHIRGGQWSVIFAGAVHLYLQEVLNISEDQPDYVEEEPDYDKEEPDYDEEEPDYDEEELDYDEEEPDYDEEELDYDKEEPDYDCQSHDAVVLALKTLLRESPADFVSLRQRIVKYDQELGCFSPGRLKSFFGWVCSNNV
jgi:hypothetical protein